MNSNQQKFWMIADPADWITPADAPAVDYDNCTQRLRLRARLDTTLNGSVDNDLRAVALTQPSMVLDAFGTVAYLDTNENAIFTDGAYGKGEFPVVLCRFSALVTVRDMAIGYDDVLYVSLLTTGDASQCFIRCIDRRGRWSVAPDAPVGNQRFDYALPSGMRGDRLSPAPDGGVWILDREQKRIGRLNGYPLADHLPGTFADTVFRPVQENANPLHISEIPVPIPGYETLVTIRCNPDGHLALLSKQTSDDETLLRLRNPDGTWNPADILRYAGQAVSMAWLSEKQLAVLPAPRTDSNYCNEAIVYDLEYSLQEKRFKPVPAGGFYPLLNIKNHLFINGTITPPHYPVINGRTAALLPMPVMAYYESGEARARVLDSGKDGTVWHRLYLEAIIPSGCGFVISIGATNDPLPNSDPEWYDHYFGDASEESQYSLVKGAWIPETSEIPHHPGLLQISPVQDRCGLFTVLIQRSGRRVRTLTGRYLHMRVKLFGRGHITPEIAAIRVYAPGFSYRDHYLPELYREELYGGDADGTGDATSADFLGRFLDLFEGILTPLEDKVAAAQVLMDPCSTPPEALEWLGSWIGVVFEPGFPAERRRAWIAAAHRLYQTHGTLAGLQLALEIATGGQMIKQFVDDREIEYPQGGAVTDGRIIVIEDFRLRRTFATILGADLSVADDPLLPGGLLSSANSYVGDTLILGEESHKEFLALFSHAFSDQAGLKAKEEQAVQQLYDKLANRVTVLVHNEFSPLNMGLIRRILSQQTPAHIEYQVVSATNSLLVGMSSLIDVDTYLMPRLPRNIARIGESRLGENAFVNRIPALDPRLTI
jgi:phage tail-like protein